MAPEATLVATAPTPTEGPRWAKWFQIIFPVLLVVLAGATAWITSSDKLARAEADAANRKEYVLTESYSKDEARRETDRKELRDWMKRVEDKLDRLSARQ